ncbi:hypothetical protein [Pseudonocardia sp.]|uniref:hypothetical protein n=1 Tax=Pseudonocardia sp. TaxID=60912 RepID=UPI00262D9E85|nr:hypothetical protein [Pseudonocardia sp.]
MSVDPRPATVSLDLGDAVELVEILTFIGDWFDSTDGPALNASLQRFAHAAYGLADLQADLARFAFLLGDEGDRLFGHLG